MGQGPKVGSPGLWPTTVAEARRVQDRLAKKVRLTRSLKAPRFIAVVDAAFSRTEVFAAACLFSYPELEPVEEKSAIATLRFPYIPGTLP